MEPPPGDELDRAQQAFGETVAIDRDGGAGRRERAVPGGPPGAPRRRSRTRSPGKAVKQAISEVHEAKRAIQEGDANALKMAGDQVSRQPV